MKAAGVSTQKFKRYSSYRWTSSNKNHGGTIEMKRRSLMRVIVLSTSVLLLSLLGCSFAQAQKRGRSSKAAGNGFVVADWRNPELVGKEDSDEIDVGDGFKAERFDRDGNDLTVHIPGAYSDTLKVGG